MKIRASAPLCHRVDDGLGSGHRDGYGRGRGEEAGYTLVMFVVIIAIMSIAMGVAVQTAEFQMRREREAELIFRGEQFIEAIRLYKIKYGRYPMQLKEIYEAKPRVVRKKWKDPITDSQNWGIVFLGQEGRRLGQGGRQLQQPGAQSGNERAGSSPIGTQTPFDSGSGEGSEADPGGTGQPGFGVPDANRMVGPIIGVHSTSCDESIKVYEGHTTYCEWQFIYREQQRQGGGGQSPAQPPVGWHPGDELKPTPGAPGGSTGSSGSPGGSQPPRPIQTPGRP